MYIALNWYKNLFSFTGSRSGYCWFDHQLCQNERCRLHVAFYADWNQHSIQKTYAESHLAVLFPVSVLWRGLGAGDGSLHICYSLSLFGGQDEPIWVVKSPPMQEERPSGRELLQFVEQYVVHHRFPYATGFRCCTNVSWYFVTYVVVFKHILISSTLLSMVYIVESFHRKYSINEIYKDCQTSKHCLTCKFYFKQNIRTYAV